MFRRIGYQVNVFFVGFAIALALFIVFKLGIGDLITGLLIAAGAGIAGNVGWFFWRRRGRATAVAPGGTNT